MQGADWLHLLEKFGPLWTQLKRFDMLLLIPGGKGATATVPLWQLQFAGQDHRWLTFKMLPTIREYLKEQADATMHTTQDLESNHCIRLISGMPPLESDPDPDEVGIVPWRAVIYCAGTSPEPALDFIRQVLEWQIQRRQLLQMPPLLVFVHEKLDFELPLPWAPCAPTAIQPPNPFAVPPPRGRRHVLCQLELEKNHHPIEGDGESQGEGEDGSIHPKYLLTIFGGIFAFRERFDQQQIAGERVDTEVKGKVNYVRYLEGLSVDDPSSTERLQSLLNDVLAKVPVYFINRVGAEDPMAKWLLAQKTVIYSEILVDDE